MYFLAPHDYIMAAMSKYLSLLFVYCSAVCRFTTLFFSAQPTSTLGDQNMLKNGNYCPFMCCEPFVLLFQSVYRLAGNCHPHPLRRLLGTGKTPIGDSGCSWHTIGSWPHPHAHPLHFLSEPIVPLLQPCIPDWRQVQCVVVGIFLASRQLEEGRHLMGRKQPTSYWFTIHVILVYMRPKIAAKVQWYI